MKKLKINPEKVLNNTELSKLRGGAMGGPGRCICHNAGQIVITGTANDADECRGMCSDHGAADFSFFPGGSAT